MFGTGVSGNVILPQGYRTDRPYCNNYAWFYENADNFPTVENWDNNIFSSDTIFKGSYFKIKQIQLDTLFRRNDRQASYQQPPGIWFS